MATFLQQNIQITAANVVRDANDVATSTTYTFSIMHGSGQGPLTDGSITLTWPGEVQFTVGSLATLLLNH